MLNTTIARFRVKTKNDSLIPLCALVDNFINEVVVMTFCGDQMQCFHFTGRWFQGHILLKRKNNQLSLATSQCAQSSKLTKSPTDSMHYVHCREPTLLQNECNFHASDNCVQNHDAMHNHWEACTTGETPKG